MPLEDDKCQKRVREENFYKKHVEKILIYSHQLISNLVCFCLLHKRNFILEVRIFKFSTLKCAKLQ